MWKHERKPCWADSRWWSVIKTCCCIYSYRKTHVSVFVLLVLSSSFPYEMYLVVETHKLSLLFTHIQYLTHDWDLLRQENVISHRFLFHTSADLMEISVVYHLVILVSVVSSKGIEYGGHSSGWSCFNKARLCERWCQTHTHDHPIRALVIVDRAMISQSEFFVTPLRQLFWCLYLSVCVLTLWLWVRCVWFVVCIMVTLRADERCSGEL